MPRLPSKPISHSALARGPCSPKRASCSNRSTVAGLFSKLRAAISTSIAAARTRRSSELSPVTNKLFSRRSEEHTSELQSRLHLVCRLLLEKKKNNNNTSLTVESYNYHELYLEYVNLNFCDTSNMNRC